MTQTTKIETAAGFLNLRKHQPVLILSPSRSPALRGIVLSPGKIQSLVRYNCEGNIKETKINNIQILPVNPKKHTENIMLNDYNDLGSKPKGITLREFLTEKVDWDKKTDKEKEKSKKKTDGIFKD